MEEARRIVGAPAPAITRFAEEQSPEQRDRIFDELNTLAVVYRQPSSAFTNAAPVHKQVYSAPPYPRMLQPFADHIHQQTLSARLLLLVVLWVFL